MVHAFSGTKYSVVLLGISALLIFLLSACAGQESKNESPTAGTASAAPTISIMISPSTLRLYPEEKQKFAAVVTGSEDTRVTWSIEPVQSAKGVGGGIGAIDAYGLYTAPANPVYMTQARIRATSVADPSRSALAVVTYRYSKSIEAAHERWLAGVSAVASTYGCGDSLVKQEGFETISDVIARFGTTASPGSCLILAPVSLDENAVRYSIAWGGALDRRDIVYISDVGEMRIWQGKEVSSVAY